MKKQTVKMWGGGILAKESLKKETFDLLNNGGGRVGMLL
jgi:hypothetical protein